ncbi:MAG TPA: DUF2336 domain-containing protein [Xanthobacteraceae bacterium]|jgi:uncharacterized protein (DUF2336 family)
MADQNSLIRELEDAIERGSSHRRAETLRRVTDLFTRRATELSEQHVALFDDVILRLAGVIETEVRAELARQLAPVDNAPPNTVRDLATDDSIEVAAPILLRSRRLTEADLVDIARTKGQAHLLAIASRRPLGHAVTDVLVDRGDGDVLFNIASNAQANFSESGMARLVDRAGDDEPLATRIIGRPDIPLHLLHQLVAQASDLVQRRLLMSAPSHMRSEIERVLAKVSHDIDPVPAPRSFKAAQRLIGMLHAAGGLGESELYDLAKSRRYEETAAALSVLCGAEIDAIDWLMNGDRIEPLLILLKAAGFDWLTARAVILCRPSGRRISAKDLEDICDDFKRLSYATARQVIARWQGGRPPMRAAG